MDYLQSKLKNYKKIQNYAAKVIAQDSKFEHVSPILKSLKWLNIENIINFRYCTIVYKCLNNAAPLYLSNLLQNYIPPCHLRSGNLNLLAIPDHSTTIGRRSFSYNGPKLWNDIPLQIREKSTIEILKHHLKQYLFNMQL